MSLPLATERVQSSIERTEDVVFQGLIRRWTEAREWRWVAAVNVVYGHVLEERERDRRCVYCETGDGHPEGTWHE